MDSTLSEILKLSDLKKLCEKHKVKSLYLFGSAAKGSFSEGQSDLDFLVEIECTNPAEKGNYLIDLWNELESMYGFSVDLITLDSISNPILLAEIQNTKLLIYESTAEIPA